MTIAIENQASIRAHSGMGIASFVIGVTSVIFFVTLIGTAGMMANTGNLTPELNMIIGLGVLSAGFVDLIGIGLGFFGSVDRASKKLYPVLGLVLNIGILLLFVALLIIGLWMKAH